MVEQAVILAGGKGTRLMPLTAHIPKPMVQVAGQPFLHWQLMYLREQGVKRVLLLISHLGHVIRDHFNHHAFPGLELDYFEEDQPMGTGGALRNALAQLEDQFWLVNGDSFLHADLARMEAHAEGRGWSACIATLTNSALVPVPGNIRLEGEEVADFRKGAGREQGFPCVDAGVYLLSRGLIAACEPGRFDLERLWPPLIAAHGLGAFPVEEKFYDIGTPDRLKQFEEHVHDYF